MPSSPDIVPDIEANDVQTPLAFEPKKKESAFGALISRGSSISSNASAGLKKFRSKSEMDPGGSPKPSPRNYTPLSSPYEANAFPSDYVHGGDVFKVSPRLKRPTPRSPKIHPSSKSHRHSRSSSGKRDKHGDSHRRVEGNVTERVVLGQSHNCSDDVPDLSPSLVVHVDQSARPKTHKKSSHKSDTSHGKHRRKSRTPEKSKTVCKDGEDINLNPMEESAYKKSKRRHKTGSNEKHAESAMVNSESTVPLLNDLSGSKQQQTTEFITRNNKPRRPVSLTESYSAGIPHVKSHHVVGNGHGPPKTPKYKPDGNSESDQTITDQRSLVLPKPDGQSPEVIREETAQSKSSTPISIISNKTLSPSKSIATPSECLELEYDDFIFEDPTSYLDPYETVKFQWQGVEKMNRTHTDKANTPNGPTAKVDSPAS